MAIVILYLRGVVCKNEILSGAGFDLGGEKCLVCRFDF